MEMWKLDDITSRTSDRIFIPIIAMHMTYTMNADRHQACNRTNTT